MSDKELEQLKDQLLNDETLNAEYLQAWGDTYKWLETIDKTHREFPTSGRELSKILDDTAENPLTYIRTLPLEIEAHSQALLKIMVRNNERIIRYFELLENKPV